MSEPSVVIVSAARTPMGAFQGALSSVSAPELGAIATKAALARSGLSSNQIDELLFGCVLTAGLGQAPARQVALGAELDLATACTTISKVCGSGMKALMQAVDQILAGSCATVIAGGMESMSRSPYLLTKARTGMRIGHEPVLDHMFTDGLEDAYTGKSMGSFAQETADSYGITREQMDAYAVESLTRAKVAIAEGYFAQEIVPVTVKNRRTTKKIEQDEQPGLANAEKIPKLKPAFANNGSITAANSSSISDGAAALVLMDERVAIERGLRPLARVIAHASHAQHPSEFTIAPVGAIKKLLHKIAWKKDDVDLYEINEAFAMVTQLAMMELDLDHQKVNVHGGACALGHPIGASGARIIVTLLHALQRLSKKRGVASLCIGGGEATAVAVELI